MTAILTRLKINYTFGEALKRPSLEMAKIVVRYLGLIFFAGMLGLVCFEPDNPIFQGKAVVAAIFVLFFFAFKAFEKR